MKSISIFPNFSLPDSLTVSGVSYPIRTDFRVILEILVMLRDPDLTDTDRGEALLRMLLLDPPPAGLSASTAVPGSAEPASSANCPAPATAETSLREALISAALEFINPLQAARTSAPRNLVDWELDFPLMVAPVNRILGYECRSISYLHWHSFLAAYWEIGPETLFGRVIRIREKLKTGQKLEKWERLFLRKNRPLIVLPSRLNSREEEILKEWVKG